MTQTLSDQQTGTVARGQAHALLAPTMRYVAVTAGVFLFFLQIFTSEER